MRNGHIGYLNKVLWSDVKSYEVFKDHDELMAVEVEKIPSKEPQFVKGGFVGTFLNNNELFDDSARIVECSEPFKVFERKGGYYRKSYDIVASIIISSYKGGKDALEAYAQEKNLGIIYDSKCENAWLIEKTQKGKLKVKYILISNVIDENCNYFYDLNF